MPGFGGVSESDRREEIVSLVDERPTTPYTVGELTVELSEWFHAETDGMVPTDEEIHSTLYDFDLPALDNSGRIVFDEATGRVYATDYEAARRSMSPDSGPEHGASVGDGSSDATALTGERVTVSKRLLTDLAVLVVGLLGVAVAASDLLPVGTSTALVPAGLVVLYFISRA
ncbi:DUF7344 domain-containing protein [Halobellus rufus]|uniref:DUF7344 domain-containing protein n=1 Tax=Halobellus rufus TaxID=1448860 RepID=UPI0009DF6E06|nr:hypothetical protein [Halobellus rufus]